MNGPRYQRRKLQMTCNGCQREAEGVMVTVPLTDVSPSVVFVRPPRGWWVAHVEFKDSVHGPTGTAITTPVNVCVGVCERCAGVRKFETPDDKNVN